MSLLLFLVRKTEKMQCTIEDFFLNSFRGRTCTYSFEKQKVNKANM